MQRSLAGYTPWGCKDSDMTERLSRHAHHRENSVTEHSTILYGWRDKLTLCGLIPRVKRQDLNSKFSLSDKKEQDSRWESGEHKY